MKEQRNMWRRSSVEGMGLLLGCAFLAACAQEGPTTLKDAYADYFLVGAAVNAQLVSGGDTLAAAIVRQQFNTITPENSLKWERVHPEPGRYDFDVPDRFVEFGERNGMVLIGHTLVWHNQTPRWVFQDAAGNPVSRDTLLDRMRDHIHTVVGRYKGRIHGWDVVNEAVDEDGSLRRSPWLEIIGEDYVARAFWFAHEVDPNAELYYNDYSLQNPAKREGALRLISDLKAQGVPVAAVGLQDHIHLDAPSIEQIDATIADFANLGVKVVITELDVDLLPEATRAEATRAEATREQGAEIAQRAEMQEGLNPYVDGLPDSVQQGLATRYHDVFAVYLKHQDTIDRVTFWGVTDAGSWKNNWPVPGRTNYPLLFDREGRPKPAFDAVIRAAQEAGSESPD
jgi:endo-1,4-beta-xylanase